MPSAVPIYARPPDLIGLDQAQQKTGLSYGRLVNGKPKAYFTRKEIEQGALANRDSKSSG
jgi:membrane-bound lytic murein transglycosylase